MLICHSQHFLKAVSFIYITVHNKANPYKKLRSSQCGLVMFSMFTQNRFVEFTVNAILPWLQQWSWHFLFCFFPPSPPLPVSGDTPLPSHLHHPLSALYFLQVYLLFGSIHTQNLFRNNSIFLYRTTLSFFAPNKSDLVCVTGAFFAV